VVRQQATAYLRRLCEFILGMHVTDADGAEYGLDAGAMLAVEMVLALRTSGRKAMIVGNGGSDAIANHLQTDLSNSVGVRAMTFDSSGMVTALSNDHGYASVFERPVQLWAVSGDLLLAISSSGRSENILRAARAARRRGCGIITLSGFRSDNPLRRLGDVNFYVPSEAYGFVEMAHAALAHFLADSAMMLRLQQAEQVTSAVWTPSDRSS
jgi:D-sedoheptulose 7-phosphate isomerase